jgi:DNA-binding transcriptional regulator YiaG
VAESRTISDRAMTARERPYPHTCSECGKTEVRPGVIPYEVKGKHDGRPYAFTIPDLRVDKCGNCGELYFDSVSDAQISEGMRKHLKLLSPDEIREGIRSLGMNQKEFAELTEIAAETVSRWLSGAYIQSRALDKYMRMYFERAVPVKASGSDARILQQ